MLHSFRRTPTALVQSAVRRSYTDRQGSAGAWPPQRCVHCRRMRPCKCLAAHEGLQSGLLHLSLRAGDAMRHGGDACRGVVCPTEQSTLAPACEAEVRAACSSDRQDSPVVQVHQLVRASSRPRLLCQALSSGFAHSGKCSRSGQGHVHKGQGQTHKWG